MILSNHYIRQRLGFTGLRGFEALPGDPRRYVLDAIPQNPGETEALFANPDGIAKVSNFGGRWQEAVALSAQIDAIRSDPLAANLNSNESQVANGLLDALQRARTYYPWGSAWGRQPQLQAGLTQALNSLDAGLSDYLGRIKAMYVQAKDAIEAREAKRQQAAIEEQQRIIEEQKRAQDAAIAQAKEQQRITAEQETLRSRQAAEAAKQQVIEAQNVTLAVKAGIASQEQIERAKETKILGLPISTAIPLGLGGAALLFFMVRRPGGAKPMQGYRRRRRR